MILTHLERGGRKRERGCRNVNNYKVLLNIYWQILKCWIKPKLDNALEKWLNSVIASSAANWWHSSVSTYLENHTQNSHTLWPSNPRPRRKSYLYKDVQGKTMVKSWKTLKCPPGGNGWVNYGIPMQLNV